MRWWRVWSVARWAVGDLGIQGKLASFSARVFAGPKLADGAWLVKPGRVDGEDVTAVGCDGHGLQHQCR